MAPATAPAIAKTTTTIAVATTRLELVRPAMLAGKGRSSGASLPLYDQAVKNLCRSRLNALFGRALRRKILNLEFWIFFEFLFNFTTRHHFTSTLGRRHLQRDCGVGGGNRRSASVWQSTWLTRLALGRPAPVAVAVVVAERANFLASRGWTWLIESCRQAVMDQTQGRRLARRPAAIWTCSVGCCPRQGRRLCATRIDGRPPTWRR